MAKTNKKVLVLSFGFSANSDKKATINISKPKTGLTDEDIKNAMTTVSENAVLGNKDVASGADVILEANYVNTETEEIAL